MFLDDLDNLGEPGPPIPEEYQMGEEDYYDEDGELIDPDILAEYHRMISEEYHLTTSCLLPTLADAMTNFLLPILVCNLVAFLLIRFLQQPWPIRVKYQLLQRFPFKFSPFYQILANLEKWIQIVSGLVLLTYYFRNDSLEMISFVFGSFLAGIFLVPMLLLNPSAAIGSRSSLGILWLFCLSLISINEAIIHFGPTSEQQQFEKLRLSFMLITMKSISYFGEINNLGTDSPLAKGKSELERFGRTLIDFASYLLHPNSIVVGVWHPYGTKKSSNEVTGSSVFRCLTRAGQSFLLSLLFLLTSTCFIDYFVVQIVFQHVLEFLQFWIPPVVVDPFEKFLFAYSNAIQFHFSHFFICFAAQSMFELWDFRLTVTRPLAIEFPRSLVDVVVAWNIPMHLWLKKYVFIPFKRRYSIYLAIFATYLISSYLHGFNFQIWTVLLTLGLLTQAEFKLRQRLGEIFAACIDSRPCTYLSFDPNPNNDGIGDNHLDGSVNKPMLMRCSKAGHVYNLGQGWFSWVRLVNLCFTLFAICNLAFLGSTFDGKPDSSSIQHVLLTWKTLGFYSHFVAVFMFILYKLI